MSQRTEHPPCRPPAGPIVFALAGAKVLLQLATAGRYGIFRDEMYYIACARHLAWGYVDHPPLIALITWLVIHLGGTSLYALRLLPALAGGGLVLLAAALCRQMGGGRFAQSVAAAAVIPVPVYLMLDHWLTMNAFEPLFWMLAVWLCLKMVERDDARYWIAIGAVAGIGLENKYSMLLPVLAMLLGLALTPQRRLLRSRWLAAGVLLAILLVLPNLLWEIQHGMPFLEFERNSRMSGSRILRSPLVFLADQVLMMNPLLAPLWIGGVVWLLRARQAQSLRWTGWMFLIVLGSLLLMKSKNYYVAPVYPIALAAGAVAFESVTVARARWLRAAYPASFLLMGAILAPFVLPLLPIERFIAYQSLAPGFTPVRIERLPDLLPQNFADEFGWEEMVRQTAVAWQHLTPQERQGAAIFANNYGEAGAIDLFGPRYGLPAAISKDKTYWLWGPRDYTGSVVIVLGSDGKGDREVFRTVEPAGAVGSASTRDIEHFDLLLCRDLTTEMQQLWPRLKAW